MYQNPLIRVLTKSLAQFSQLKPKLPISIDHTLADGAFDSYVSHFEKAGLFLISKLNQTCHLRYPLVPNDVHPKGKKGARPQYGDQDCPTY